ncbi:FAD binding domain-containing protein [Methylopila sp. M107]|uniref:FAD binding domain-containing protein n=1 Tax=Methylopila sp. M107 TaxID=1101190 RepID=UPI000382A777|nr:FAD binding domain-containing protein [Methylopila sp. M107]
MDINTITEIVTRPEGHAKTDWRDGDAWLGGGTWIYSEPQPALRRLVDLDGFGWTPLELTEDALVVAATCKIRELHDFEPPAGWAASGLIRQCCDALLGSFKIWNMATVGGNMCLALPAGPMTSLAASLDGTCVIWTLEGAERRVRAVEFVVGDRRTALARGELLRAIELPVSSFLARSAFRQVSLTPRGRSAALLVGLAYDDGRFVLTITASTKRPVRLAFDAAPSAEALTDAIGQAIPADLYHDDIHGLPAWRRHLTFHLAEEIRQELVA